MSRNLVIAIAVALAFAFATTTAFAHARLETAVPAVGGTVSSSPTELRLKFSEGIEPHFSGVALTDASGAAQSTGPSAIDPADKSVLVVKVGTTLKPGVYTVTWHAVSVDTHKTQGHYTFTVAP